MLRELWQLFSAFAKVGIFGYGGGPSMIPLVQEEVVNVHHWMDNQEFVDALAMGNALPGPIATKMSAYSGFKVAGLPGATMALLGIVLPSILPMLGLAALFFQYKGHPWVQATLKAVRPVVVTLLLLTVYEIFPSSIKSWDTLLIAIVAFAATAFLHIHPAIAILAAAVLGVVIYR